MKKQLLSLMAVSFVAVGSSYAAENAITDISVMSNIQSQSWVGEELTDGDFYLYNVGSQNYMTAGNNWGTRASLGPAGYTIDVLFYPLKAKGYDILKLFIH